ncbi:hypothetical protein B0T14DRAFT_569405 [Immersiella caudata]|uniref:Uncharacterized protein n=1 Tax=Immersiella caudata TaxID=314043 RepID=A0AA39WDE3_9PEZI|nr:hypothetical protein B0T14DRAFT_569405 [Immersiella caudata]
MSSAARLDHAKEVADILEALCKKVSYTDLLAVYQENKRLKEEIEDYRAVKRRNEQELAEYRHEIESAKQDAKGKGEKLSAEEKKKEELNSQHHETLQKLNTTMQKLTSMDNEIRRLQGFSITMKTAPQGEIIRILQSLFESARAFAEAYFVPDLSTDILQEPSHWEKLKERTRPIPLPATNSPPAKQVRVAAALVIVSRIISRHIFSPVYLTDRDGELSVFLGELGDKDSSRESYLRSVLLKSVADVQQTRAAERVQIAVDEISRLLRPLFTGEDRASLTSALEELCQKACIDWQRIQQLQQKIEPNFKHYPEYADEWLPFSLKKAASLGSNQKPQQNGQRDTGKPKAGKAPLAAPGGETPEIVVWPSFILNESGEALTKGYVLRDTHLRAAREEEERLQKEVEEEKKRRLSAQPTRRDIRNRGRKSSIGVASGSRPSSNEGFEYIDPKGTAESFLPLEAGGGPKGG